MELSTYFRINERNTGQFERTLIIADKGSYVSYLEGCTAAAARREPVACRGRRTRHARRRRDQISTVQNWYPGNSEGKGGIYNFVTKRGDCRGKNSKISWTQVETGSAITWKYPSCILRGDNSRGEFYSIAISNGFQQVDSGTKMLHLGKTRRAGSFQGHRCRQIAEHLSRPRHCAQEGDRCAQLHGLRFAPDRRQMRAHTVPYIEPRTRRRPSSTRRRRRKFPKMSCSIVSSAD